MTSLDLHLSGQSWRLKAACHVTSPDDDIWWSTRTYDKIMAATICERCPVRDECYLQAVADDEHGGIRGGVDFSTAARKRIAYCKRGHLFADDMYVLRDGREVTCARCHKDRQQAKRDAQQVTKRQVKP